METNAKCMSGGGMSLFWFKNKTVEPVGNCNDKVLNYMT